MSIISDKFGIVETPTLIRDFMVIQSQIGSQSPETMVCAAYLLTFDQYLLDTCTTSEELRHLVLKNAIKHGHYAGMNYIAGEHLPPDDPNFQDASDGLSWVAFGDMWEVFEKMAGNLPECN